MSASGSTPTDSDKADTSAKPKNRNAERSIRLLETSLARLLAEKPYEKITVTDVTTEAGLNRGTFYAHFSSIDDLRDTVLRKLMATLTQLLDKVADTSFVDDPLPILSEVGHYLQTNRKLLQKLVSSKTLEPFLSDMRVELRAHIHAHLSAGNPSDAPACLLVADYLSYGILGVYHAWLVGDYGDLDVERVSEELCSLVRDAGATVAQIQAKAEAGGD